MYGPVPYVALTHPLGKDPLARFGDELSVLSAVFCTDQCFRVRGELHARIHTLAGLSTQFDPPDHDTPTTHNEIRNCLGHGVFG